MFLIAPRKILLVSLLALPVFSPVSAQYNIPLTHFQTYGKNAKEIRVHFKFSRVGGDTNPGSAPGAVTPPPTLNAAMRQFEMHPESWQLSKPSINVLKKICQDTPHKAPPVFVALSSHDILKSVPENNKTFVEYPYNKKRVRAVAIANIASYTGSMLALNELWYKNNPRTGFHFFDDNAQWLQMDKAGHVYSAYVASNASMEMWRWAGLERKQRVWLGGLGGVAYQSVIEILDGFSADYGFSIGDFAANVLGSAIFVSQEFAWDEQKIKLKFSFHQKTYGEKELDERIGKLFGKSTLEQLLKDYNGQTYWASANLHSFTKVNNLPKWLNIAVGYGADGMFGGVLNIGRDENGEIYFDRKDIKRYRQWYLAPDIDFTRIKTNKQGIKILLFVLNSFKMPTPGLELSNGKLKGKWLIF